MMTDPVPSGTPDARELIRNLVDLEADVRSDEAPVAASATLATSERLYRELSRWVGSVGCHALFPRALAEARVSHPLLTDVRVQKGDQPYFEGTAEIIDAHGASATAEAFEAMLVTLVGLLGRLIGDDMAVKLILQSLPEVVRDTRSLEARRPEA